MSPPPVVVVDACVLVRNAVRDVFFDFAQLGLIDMHWTREIYREFAKNWAKVRVQQLEGELAKEGLPPLTPEDRERKLVELEYEATGKYRTWWKMVPEWPVPGWAGEDEAKKEFAKSMPAFRVGHPKHEGVDPKDLHVALAAARTRNAYTTKPNDPEGGAPREVWLLTDNLADLPPKVMLAFGVVALDPTEALEELYEREPKRVAVSLEQTRSQWTRDPVSREKMLELLLHPDHFDSKPMRDAMAIEWNLP